MQFFDISCLILMCSVLFQVHSIELDCVTLHYTVRCKIKSNLNLVASLMLYATLSCCFMSNSKIFCCVSSFALHLFGLLAHSVEASGTRHAADHPHCTISIKTCRERGGRAPQSTITTITSERQPPKEMRQIRIARRTKFQSTRPHMEFARPPAAVALGGAKRPPQTNSVWLKARVSKTQVSKTQAMYFLYYIEYKYFFLCTRSLKRMSYAPSRQA